jgi:hypothetical protein
MEFIIHYKETADGPMFRYGPITADSATAAHNIMATVYGLVGLTRPQHIYQISTVEEDEA